MPSPEAACRFACHLISLFNSPSPPSHSLPFLCLSRRSNMVSTDVFTWFSESSMAALSSGADNADEQKVLHLKVEVELRPTSTSHSQTSHSQANGRMEPSFTSDLNSFDTMDSAVDVEIRGMRPIEHPQHKGFGAEKNFAATLRDGTSNLFIVIVAFTDCNLVYVGSHAVGTFKTISPIHPSKNTSVPILDVHSPRPFISLILTKTPLALYPNRAIQSSRAILPCQPSL